MAAQARHSRLKPKTATTSAVRQHPGDFMQAAGCQRHLSQKWLRCGFRAVLLTGREQLNVQPFNRACNSTQTTGGHDAPGQWANRATGGEVATPAVVQAGVPQCPQPPKTVCLPCPFGRPQHRQQPVSKPPVS